MLSCFFLTPARNEGKQMNWPHEMLFGVSLEPLSHVNIDAYTEVEIFEHTQTHTHMR